MTTINSGSYSNYLNYSNYSNRQMPKQDPDAYAKQYAEQHGIDDIEKAKEELKAKFGDPSVGAQIPNLSFQNQSIFSQNISQNTNDFSNYDINNFDYSNFETNKTGENTIFSRILNMFGATQAGQANSLQGTNPDPEKYAKEYAEENNITLEEAKEELKSQFGEPQQFDAFA